MQPNKVLEQSDVYELESMLAELQIYGNSDAEFSDIIKKHISNMLDKMFVKDFIDVINLVTSRVNEILDIIKSVTNIKSVQDDLALPEENDDAYDSIYKKILEDASEKVKTDDFPGNDRANTLMQMEEQLSVQSVYVDQALSDYDSYVIFIIKEIIESYIKMKREL